MGVGHRLGFLPREIGIASPGASDVILRKQLGSVEGIFRVNRLGAIAVVPGGESTPAIPKHAPAPRRYVKPKVIGGVIGGNLHDVAIIPAIGRGARGRVLIIPIVVVHRQIESQPVCGLEAY